jgi:hypothetical protein
MPQSPDDLPALAAERAAADRAYNDALTRLDHAIQQLPADFPRPPRGPDEHQVTPLNTLWETAPPAARGWRCFFTSGRWRAVAPIFARQQAFNAAVVDHINRSVPVARETRESLETTLTVLHDTIAELARFQSLLVVFLQQITPYVDTRDRDVAGLLRGLSGAINAVADEVMKRAETARTREARREQHDQAAAERLTALDQQLRTLEASLIELRRRIERPDAS